MMYTGLKIWPKTPAVKIFFIYSVLVSSTSIMSSTRCLARHSSIRRKSMITFCSGYKPRTLLYSFYCLKLFFFFFKRPISFPMVTFLTATSRQSICYSWSSFDPESKPQPCVWLHFCIHLLPGKVHRSCPVDQYRLKTRTERHTND